VSRVYIAAGETKNKAIGTTNLTLNLGEEDFEFQFQIVDGLSTNILIGMDFIKTYHCVIYANDGLFTLRNGRVEVPMCVKGSCLGLAKLREQITLEPHTQHIVGLHCPKIYDKTVYLLEPLSGTEDQGYRVPRTILSTKGFQYCQLWNSTNEPIDLTPGTLIGQISSVDEILSIAKENNVPPVETRTNLLQSGYRNKRLDGNHRNQNHRNQSYRNQSLPQEDWLQQNKIHLLRQHLPRQKLANTNKTFYSKNIRYSGNNNAHDRSIRATKNSRGDNYRSRVDNNNTSLQTSPLIPASKPDVRKHTFEELKLTLTNPAITPAQKNQFWSLIEEFGDIFALNNAEFPGTDRLEFKINMQQNFRPIRQRPYSYSQEARTKIEKQIQELLAVKFIRHSISPWASNILLVRKKSGEMRFCIDYRSLNKFIIPEIHAVPSFSCIHDTLSYAKPVIFTTLDLRSAFHCLKVEESSMKYTAFQSHLGQFEFTRSPFGISTVPSHMVRLMGLILSEKKGPLMKSALAYIDDVLCYSASVEEHFVHLWEIFQRFRDSQMRLNPKKCNFLLSELIFLGNLLNAKGVGPDPDKVKAMLEFPIPTTQKKLKGALGMFQFYKKYIPGYSTIIIPLNRLLLKNASFHWTEVEQAAFEKVRTGLKNAPFMEYPSDEGIFTLETDASTKSIGYVLLQSRPEGEDGIIACGGRSLRGAEFNYTVTELEMLSVVEALERYRHYLMGRHFKMKSDHLSLRFINSLKDSSVGRLFRWSLHIQGFDFELI